jgi:flagellar motor switch protein FliG
MAERELMTNSTDISGLSGVRKAAILLTMLGDDAAAVLFRNLEEADMQRVADEVVGLGHIPVELSLKVFQEYQRMTQAQDYLIQGGQQLARRLLIKAFGEREAEEILTKLTKAHELTPLEILQRAEPQKLARLLDGEHPQTIALLLGQLGDRQASAVLMSLQQDVRADAVKRLANLRRFSPEMASRVSKVLSERLMSIGEQGKKTYSGFQSVADIMNCIDTTVAQEILESIEGEEPSLAISIRDLMFTFADLLRVGEAQIREIAGYIDKRILATALKGAPEDLRNHFFRTMSSRAVEMMKEDMESLGPVRNKDVLRAQSEVVTAARNLEAEGKIILKGEGNDEYVV